MPGPAVYGRRALAGRLRAGHARPLQVRGYQLRLQQIRGRLAGGAGGCAGSHAEGGAAAEGPAAKAGDGTQRAHAHRDKRCAGACGHGAGGGLQQAGGIGGGVGHDGKLGNVSPGVRHAGQGGGHRLGGGGAVKVMLAEKRCGPGGVGGVAQLARAAGHRVTGCDQNVYPPMSDALAANGIEITQGYGAEQLELSPDLWVVGNAISRGNPLLEAILNAGLPYTSGPQWMSENILQGREVLAVAGTHGKTTTTSMLAWILKEAGFRPGYLIGGLPCWGEKSAELGDLSAPFVIEADEYDTAFCDKRSKFVHYRPRIAILNNLEYDHADIFPNLAAIETQFHHLVRIMPGEGTVIANARSPALDRVLARGCWSRRTVRRMHTPGSTARLSRAARR